MFKATDLELFHRKPVNRTATKQDRERAACSDAGNLRILEVLFKYQHRDFPGGPVVKTSPSNAGGVGSIPDQRAKTPFASSQNQSIKQKQNYNKFNKGFKKLVHMQKKKTF